MPFSLRSNQSAAKKESITPEISLLHKARCREQFGEATPLVASPDRLRVGWRQSNRGDQWGPAGGCISTVVAQQLAVWEALSYTNTTGGCLRLPGLRYAGPVVSGEINERQKMHRPSGCIPEHRIYQDGCGSKVRISSLFSR